MRLRYYSYRYAEAVLNHEHFKQAKDEILRIFKAAPVPLLDPEEPDPKRGGVKRRKRKKRKGDLGPRYLFLPVDQKSLNGYLDQQFEKLAWQCQPQIVDKGSEGPVTRLKGDYKKGPLQVEVQFGNMARWYTDVFKFQLSYSLGTIDAAVLVVPTQRFANAIDENVAYFERVKRELPWAKMSLTLPILVIGIEPTDFSDIVRAYDRAFEVLAEENARKGKTILKIPFEERVQEEDDDVEAV